jgi:hypothetical protein
VMKQVREQVGRKNAGILGLDVKNQPAVPDVVVVAKDR